MPNWTVQEIMDFTQELIGEPAGSYYNLSTRLKLLNQAHREMIRLARSMRSSTSQTTTANTAEYYYPFDFSTFNKEQPYISNSSTTHKLTVVDVDYMDRQASGWRDSSVSTGTPRYLVMIDTATYRLYPTPSSGWALTLPYTPIPEQLTDLDDEVFAGYEGLDEYALGLAYKVAAQHMLPRAPQLAREYKSLYEDTLQEMRWAMRTNPQHHLSIRPTGYER